MSKNERPTIESEAAVLGEDDSALFQTDETVEYADPSAEDATATPESPAGDQKPDGGDQKPDGAPRAEAFEVPEHLRNKSPAELAKMYVEAQKLLGRQGQELGELRAHADAFLKANLAAQAAAARQQGASAQRPKPMEDVDFFANPKEAIERAVAEHPEVKRLRAENESVKAMAMQERMRRNAEMFHAKHPDAAEVMNDAEFQAWVMASPIRQRLLARAHTAYDFLAGDEVFSTWKALRAPKQQAAARPEKTAARAAAQVPTGGNATAPRSNTGEKIFRRADLIKLQLNDPERYEMMSDEIARAYAEGRVR